VFSILSDKVIRRRQSRPKTQFRFRFIRGRKHLSKHVSLANVALLLLRLSAAIPEQRAAANRNAPLSTKLPRSSDQVSVLLAAAVVGSSAFAPSQQAKTNTALNAFQDELGAQAPIGFWDPLQMTKGVSQERFDRLRYVELKHGRIAMLAFMGQIATRAGIHLPGSIDAAGHSFDSFPNGHAAILGDNAIPIEGIFQIGAFIGFLELFVMKDSANGAAPGDFPGDFRNGFLDFGWDRYSEETKLKKRAVELNNGRAAQMGILGLMVHEQLGSNMPIIGQL